MNDLESDVRTEFLARELIPFLTTEKDIAKVARQASYEGLPAEDVQAAISCAQKMILNRQDAVANGLGIGVMSGSAIYLMGMPGWLAAGAIIVAGAASSALNRINEYYDLQQKCSK